MMSSTSGQFEAAVFQALVPQLEAEGFEVFLHPSRKLLPKFLHTCQPDAIAFKGNRKLAIEIISSSAGSEERLERLRQLFSGHADWEFRVVYAPPRTSEQSISALPRELLEDHLKRIEVAFDAVGTTAGILIAWSVFEAAARILIPSDLERPQQPSRLLEVLASNGYITPDEADVLRRLGRLRNEAAHGRLDVPLTRGDLEKLVHITRTLLELHDRETAE